MSSEKLISQLLSNGNASMLGKNKNIKLLATFIFRFHVYKIFLIPYTITISKLCITSASKKNYSLP